LLVLFLICAKELASQQNFYRLPIAWTPSLKILLSKSDLYKKTYRIEGIDQMMHLGSNFLLGISEFADILGLIYVLAKSE
jgi:hypothetical protein